MLYIPGCRATRMHPILIARPGLRKGVAGRGIRGSARIAVRVVAPSEMAVGRAAARADIAVADGRDNRGLNE